MTVVNMNEAVIDLTAADAARDPEALAAIGWKLFAALGDVQARLDALRAQCHGVPADAWPVNRLPAALAGP